MKQVKVCIDGIIGAGKSTLIKHLKPDYNCYEEPIEKWSLLTEFYNDMKTYSAPFQFQVLFSQYDQQELFKNHKMVIVERCPWTSKNIFSQMMMDAGLFDREYIKTYEKFHKILSYDVDHFIYLKVGFRQAFDRVEARNRFAEQKLNIEYLEKLEKRYEKMLLTTPQSSPSFPKAKVHIVDASVTTKEIEKSVREILKSIYYEHFGADILEN